MGADTGMNNDNIIAFPPSASYTPEMALQSVASHNVSDVLIVGYDQDGDLVVRSSRMSKADALFLLEKAKEWVMG